MANITVFSVSEFSSLGRMCCPWWQHHEAAVNRMENLTKLHVKLLKGFCQTANVIGFGVNCVQFECRETPGQSAIHRLVKEFGPGSVIDKKGVLS
jgi:hypothetical protein